MNQSPFCEKEQHEDCMIQVACLDYSRQTSYRMCKKCNQQFGDVQETLEQQYEEMQTEFKNKFCSDNQQTYEDIFNQQLNTYCSKFRAQLVQILQRVPMQFQNATRDLKQSLISGNQMNSKDVDEKISFYNKENIEIKQEVNDLIYKQLDEVEKFFFPFHLHENNQLFSLPTNEVILNNLDVVGLLQKYQQIYINKFQRFNEKQLIQHGEENMLRILEQRNLHSQFEKKWEKLVTTVKKSLEVQMNQMIVRLQQCRDRFLLNQQAVSSFLDNCPSFANNFQIQVAESNDFVKICQLDKLVKTLELESQRQLASQSRFCHVGKIDVSVSLEEVQANFCINEIPFIIKGGDQVLIPIIQPSQLPTKLIQQKPLFNIDFSQFFLTNIFDYNHKINDDSNNIYEEIDGRWTCLQISHNEYTLTIRPNAETIMVFTRIKILNNNNTQQFDESAIVSVQCQSQRLLYSGCLNKKLQFNGQGDLTKNNIKIYNGNFENGRYQGFGIQYYRDDYQYHGYFVNGLRHGKGVIKKKQGGKLNTIETAQWNEDFPIQSSCQIF